MRTASLPHPKGDPDVKEKVLSQMDSGMKKNFSELFATSGVARSDLINALEELISEGLLTRSSDGFVTLYSRR